MRKYLLAAALAAFCSPAYADLVRFDNPFQSNAASTNTQSFVDFGGIGFGSAPRVLTLQTSPIQTGSVAPANTPDGLAFTGDAIDNGQYKGSAPTLGELGWLGGSQIAVGYNSNQTGGSGITLLDITLSLYDSNNSLVSSFSTGPAPVQYSQQELALQQGNGVGLFVYVLDDAQRAAFNLLGAQADWRIGLSASLGCAGAESATCQPSNDGPDSFLVVAGGNPIINPTCPDCTPTPQAVPGPIVGAGIPGLIVACLGLVGLARRRRQAAA
jgi:hypothetical protein